MRLREFKEPLNEVAIAAIPFVWPMLVGALGAAGAATWLKTNPDVAKNIERSVNDKLSSLGPPSEIPATSPITQILGKQIEKIVNQTQRDNAPDQAQIDKRVQSALDAAGQRVGGERTKDILDKAGPQRRGPAPVTTTTSKPTLGTTPDAAGEFGASPKPKPNAISVAPPVAGTTTVPGAGEAPSAGRDTPGAVPGTPVQVGGREGEFGGTITKSEPATSAKAQSAAPATTTTKTAPNSPPPGAGTVTPVKPGPTTPTQTTSGDQYIYKGKQDIPKSRVVKIGARNPDASRVKL